MRSRVFLVPTALVLVLLGLTALPISYAQLGIGSTSAYLPLVFKGVDLPLLNGGFEEGSTGWSFFNGAFSSSGGVAHSGRRFAFLGGDDEDQEAIRQSFSVPIERPYLEYWYNAVSSETVCTDDIAYVRINTETKETIEEFCEDQEHRTWERRVIDLRDYSGQIIEIEFVISTDMGLASQWSIDDVALVATP